MNHCHVEFLLVDVVTFVHVVGELCLLNHHLHHAFHGVSTSHATHCCLWVAHHFLHGLKLLLFTVEEDFLGLVTGQLWGSGSSSWLELSLHECLLSLWVRHVDLMHLHELLLVHSNVLHGVLKQVSAHLFLLLDHFLDNFLVVRHLSVLEELSSALEEICLLDSESCLSVLLYDEEHFLVIVEGQQAVHSLLGGSESIDLFQYL